MPADAKDPREAVALFRFGLIAPVLHLAPGPERAAALQQIADREHAIPGSRRRRVAVSTLQTWRRRHQQGGFQALHPKRRSDRNQPRRLPPEVAALLTAIKEREPRLTVKAVIRQAHDSGRVPDGLRLAPSTVNRLLKQAGLMERPAEQPAGGDLRRYQWRFANDLWQADALHGPKIAAAEPGRRQAKVYLLATLDDATRVVPHAAFAYSENADNFLPSSGRRCSNGVCRNACIATTDRPSAASSWSWSAPSWAPVWCMRGCITHRGSQWFHDASLPNCCAASVGSAPR